MQLFIYSGANASCGSTLPSKMEENTNPSAQLTLVDCLMLRLPTLQHLLRHCTVWSRHNNYNLVLSKLYQKCIVNNAWLLLIPVLEKLFKLPKCKCMYVLLCAYNNNCVFKILRRNSRAYITKQAVRQCLCGGSYCMATIYPVRINKCRPTILYVQ